MSMAMRDSCYCCPSSLPATTHMDVDAALNELGMLSAVTDSRKQYLDERKRSKSETKLSQYDTNVVICKKYRVLQIDPSYVTGFNTESGLKDDMTFKSGKSTECSSSTLSHNGLSSNFQYRIQSDRLEVDARERRLSRIRMSRLRRFRKPYEVPWRLYHSFQESELSRDSSSPSPQSKSNSSSPVKFSDAPLVRSKSLDNLDFIKLRLSELFEKDTPSASTMIAEKQEIETVSKELKKLQVTDLI